MELIDSHCHLSFSPLNNAVQQTLDHAKTNGVTRIIVPAFDLESFSPVCALNVHTEVSIALGLHPWKAGQRLDINLLGDTLKEHRAVAIGEIGLDKACNVPLDIQQRCLDAQLELATDLALPVILHCRKASGEILETLKRYDTLTGVIHAFNMSEQLAHAFITRGFFLGIGGTITASSPSRIRKIISRLPLDQLLLETDAPSMGMRGVPGAQMTPSRVLDIAEAISTLSGVSVEKIARYTTSNAHRVFALD